VSPLIQKLAAKTCAAIDSGIGNIKNYVATDSEVDSQKLCRCRLKNQHQKTVSPPIQKSAAKTMSPSIQKSTLINCVAAD
jgi:hypothetical protein